LVRAGVYPVETLPIGLGGEDGDISTVIPE
jgi:hypothetical protein